jgi:hypothetical protein
MKDRRKLWQAPDNFAEDWKTLAKSLIIRDEFSYAAYLRADRDNL